MDGCSPGFVSPGKRGQEAEMFREWKQKRRMQQIGVTAAVVSPRPISIGHTAHLTEVTPIFMPPLKEMEQKIFLDGKNLQLFFLSNH